MTAEAATVAGARIDNYPSRLGLPAQFLQRLDPVVHARDSSGPVSASQLAQYEDQGFFILEDVFSNVQICALQEEQKRLRVAARDSADESRIPEPGDSTLRSIFAIHDSNEVFSRLTKDPRLVDIARFLLDDDIYVHQSRLNYKPGFRGKEFYWHSDFETWHVEDGMPGMRALSMSIVLTENSPSNGPLMLIPGSHKRYVACDGNTPQDHYRKSLRKQEYGVPPDALITQLVEEGGIVAVDARPGSVIVFDCNTMHGSNGNITPFPRANAFIVYNAIKNRVGDPYCDRPPRPEYLCTRQFIRPLDTCEGVIVGE